VYNPKRNWHFLSDFWIFDVHMCYLIYEVLCSSFRRPCSDDPKTLNKKCFGNTTMLMMVKWNNEKNIFFMLGPTQTFPK
jgi:hypothetical protein